jgi:uncharacterized damage-inducible protein DinB
MSCAETERYVRNWNRIHKQTSRALRAAPGGHLEWRPGPGMFTLRELISHIPDAEFALVRSALAGSTKTERLTLADQSVAQIADAFDSQHEQLVVEVSMLTLDGLNEEVEFHGKKMRRKVLLSALTEHEIHHRGQLFTYYRLLGIEPPNLYD